VSQQPPVVGFHPDKSPMLLDENLELRSLSDAGEHGRQHRPHLHIKPTINVPRLTHRTTRVDGARATLKSLTVEKRKQKPKAGYLCNGLPLCRIRVESVLFLNLRQRHGFRGAKLGDREKQPHGEYISARGPVRARFAVCMLCG
jgi:hypothetical protein